MTVKNCSSQERVQRGIIMIVYIKTLENIAACGGNAGIMTIQCVGHQLSQHRAYALGTIDAITAVITTL